MICLTDNDIIKKLAICGLFDEAIEFLGVSPTDILVLPTAKHVLGVAKPGKRRSQFDEQTLRRLEEFFSRVSEISFAPDPAELQLFDDIHAIDQGEAILFSASEFYRESFLATGDKRSLKALVVLPGASMIVERLTGRVICFEQLVLGVINQRGFEHVRTRVVPVSDCDTALRAAFGSGLDASEANVCDCLTRYVEDLREGTGVLLAMFGQ
jgi:hypothetical protein